MADTLDLANVLLGKQKEYYANNPFLGAVQPLVQAETPNVSGKKGAFVDAARQAAAMLLGRIGQGQAEQQYQNYAQGVSEGLGSEDPLDYFSKRQGYGEVAQAFALDQQRRQQLMQELNQKEQIKAQYKPPKLMNIFEPDGKMHQTFFQPGTGEMVHGPSVDRNRPRTVGAPRPSMQPVTEEEIASFAKQFGDDPLELSKTIQTKGDLDRYLRAKGMAGQKVRPPAPTELTQLFSNSRFNETLNELKSLAQEMSDTGLKSVRRAVKAGKMGRLLADTKSPEYRYHALLTSAQQEFARGRDSGALSTFDVKLYGPLFEGEVLIDTKSTILKRLDDAQRRSKVARNALLTTLDKGQVNVDNFMNEEIAPVSPSPAPTAATYTEQEALSAGYTAAEISSLKQQGLIK